MRVVGIIHPIVLVGHPVAHWRSHLAECIILPNSYIMHSWSIMSPTIVESNRNFDSGIAIKGEKIPFTPIMIELDVDGSSKEAAKAAIYAQLCKYDNDNETIKEGKLITLKADDGIYTMFIYPVGASQKAVYSQIRDAYPEKGARVDAGSISSNGSQVVVYGSGRIKDPNEQWDSEHLRNPTSGLYRQTVADIVELRSNPLRRKRGRRPR